MFPEGRILDFLIFGVVALVVVGPKDLPILMRKLGAAMARMRALAAEFRMNFEEMARQSELDELRAEVDALRSGRPLATLTGADQARSVVSEIESSLAGGAVRLDPSAAWRGDVAEPPAPVGAPAPEGEESVCSPAAPAEALPEAVEEAELPQSPGNLPSP